MVGTLWGLFVPSILVYKIWWPSRYKQLWEGRGEYEKGKNSVFVWDCSLGTQEKTNGTSMLWSIDSYQNRVSAGRYHLQVGVTPSQGGNPRTYAGMAWCLSTLFVNFKPGIWDSRECSAATILQMYSPWSAQVRNALGPRLFRKW